MLGGSVYIAFLRFTLCIIGTVLIFLQLDEPRFSKKTVAVIYGLFCVVASVLSCIWYLADWESCIRMITFSVFGAFILVSLFISNKRFYLTVYNLAFTFYLTAVFIVGGIEIARVFFDGNIWADVAARILIILVMIYWIRKCMRKMLKGFDSYLETEMDAFSVMILIISLFSGIGIILIQHYVENNGHRLIQLVVNFFLTGALQVVVIRLYLHMGMESEYQQENQLMKMNQRLLGRQLELLEESVESGRRIRHDIRHHNRVIAEDVRRGQTDALLEYLKQYEHKMEAGVIPVICANTAVNNILSAYTRWAKMEKINVTIDAEVDKEFGVSDMDMVTILSNAYENAIYGCIEAREQMEERECFIHLLVKKKGNKLVIYCSNTCKLELDFRKGQPKPEFTGGIGVSSIIKTAEHYDGEADFKNDDGVFVFRLIMNIPKQSEMVQ